MRTGNQRKKLLLTVDRSELSLEAVRYVGKVHPFHCMDVVLFTVQSKVPDYYWDLNGTDLGWKTTEIRAWEREKERKTDEYMDKAARILWRAGFPKQQVIKKIHDREKGVALDIIKEAEKGYSAVVVSRKGTSLLRNLVLGSVPFKLMEKLVSVPLFIVGPNVRPGSVLVAVDESEGTMKAVEVVGDLLGGSDYQVEMIHVIRGEKVPYLQDAKKQIEKAFDNARDRLLRAGFAPDQITTKIVTNAGSRSGAIVQEAVERGYGTIVVGRRGLSKVQDFFMGRVSNRVIQMAVKNAVWVI